MNHIKVKNREQDERYVMLTLVDGGRLTLSTLESVFPGSSALYYKENDLICAVGRRQNGYGLNEPFFEGGNGWWAQHVFFTSKDASPPGAPAIRGRAAKRSRMDDSQAMDTQVATTSQRVEEARKYFYYDLFPKTPKDDGSTAGLAKNCVVAITAKIAVTFRHEPHQKMRVGQTLSIYKEDGDGVPISVICAYVNDFDDFIFYHRQDDGSFAAPKIEQPTLGTPYLLLGFPFWSQVPHCFQGTVSCVAFIFELSPIRVLGHGGSARGYSGGPAFSIETGALIAMNIAGPYWNIFLSGIIEPLMAEMFKAAKEATYSLMIPMNVLTNWLTDQHLQINIDKWSGENLLKTTNTLRGMLQERVKIQENQEVEVFANWLVQRGYCWEDFQQEETIRQLALSLMFDDKSLMFDDKTKVFPFDRGNTFHRLWQFLEVFKLESEQAAGKSDGPGSSQNPQSHSTQKEVGSSMESNSTVQTGQENVEDKSEK